MWLSSISDISLQSNIWWTLICEPCQEDGCSGSDGGLQSLGSPTLSSSSPSSRRKLYIATGSVHCALASCPWRSWVRGLANELPTYLHSQHTYLSHSSSADLHLHQPSRPEQSCCCCHCVISFPGQSLYQGFLLDLHLSFPCLAQAFSFSQLWHSQSNYFHSLSFARKFTEQQTLSLPCILLQAPSLLLPFYHSLLFPNSGHISSNH